MKDKTKAEIWLFCLYAYAIIVGGIISAPGFPIWGSITLGVLAYFAANKVMSFFKE